MLHPKSFFSGLIQMANPMHPDAVTSGCDRGGEYPKVCVNLQTDVR